MLDFLQVNVSFGWKIGRFRFLWYHFFFKYVLKGVQSQSKRKVFVFVLAQFVFENLYPVKILEKS